MKAWIAALPLVVAGMGCKRPVEVKQDTPQGTITSLVKLYASKEADQRARVSELIDPALLRERAREKACSSEDMTVASCELKQMEAMRNCRSKYGCFVSCGTYFECACGTKGKEGAAHPAAFAGSDLDKALGNSGLDPLTCKVTDVQQRVGTDFGKINLTVFAYWHTCDDVKDEDRLALVSMTCGAKDPWIFVLRETDTVWRLLGFDTNSDSALKMIGTFTGAADENKKKVENLNKDMK